MKKSIALIALSALLFSFTPGPTPVKPTCWNPITKTWEWIYVTATIILPGVK